VFLCPNGNASDHSIEYLLTDTADEAPQGLPRGPTGTSFGRTPRPYIQDVQDLRSHGIAARYTGADALILPYKMRRLRKS